MLTTQGSVESAVSQRRYNLRRAVSEISALLFDAKYKCAAANVGAFVHNEPRDSNRLCGHPKDRHLNDAKACAWTIVW
jgi:hypothetical protein